MVSRFEIKISLQQKRCNYKTNSDEYLIILGLIEGVITTSRAQARRKPSHLLLLGVRRPFLIFLVRFLARGCSIPFEPRKILIAPLYHPPEDINIKLRHSGDRIHKHRVRDNPVVLLLLQRDSGRRLRQLLRQSSSRHRHNIEPVLVMPVLRTQKLELRLRIR